MIKIIDHYTIEEVQNTRDCLYVFGDNILRRGKGGQAIIRDEYNTRGIVTKQWPSMDDGAFFNDEEFDRFTSLIDYDIRRIKSIEHLYTIVFPSGGIGTGLAEMPIRSPKVFKYLCDELFRNFGYKNTPYEKI